MSILNRCRTAVAVAMFIAGALAPHAAQAADELKPYLQAHGGTGRWSSFGAVEFDLSGWPFSARAPLADHQLLDLESRRTLITSPAYRLGFDGKNAWAAPRLDAAGVSPHFYVATPAYFFSLPFAFERPGVRVQDRGERFIGDQVFDAYDIRFGTAPARRPANHFVAYFSTGTQHLYLIHFAPTKPAWREALASTPAGELALVFDRWQDLDDLIVPRQATFYIWDTDRLGQRLGSITFSNVRFDQDRPPREMFARPGDAVIDPERL